MRRLALLILLLLPAPALAARGQVVTSAGGYELHARHGAHGGVCLTLRGPDDEQDHSGCQPVYSPFAPVLTSSFRPTGPDGIAVPATVARVSVGTTSVDTIAVDGFDVRFALIHGAGPSRLVRLFDAGGALIGAARGDDDDFLGQGGTTVFSDTGERVKARRSFDLEPTPLEPDRTIPKTCLDVRIGQLGTEPCARDRDLGQFTANLMPACAPARALLHGLVGPSVTQVAVVLGTGRVLRARTRPLPARLGPGRLVAVSIPPGMAVRSARGLDRSGHPATTRKVLGAAPSGLRCPKQSFFGVAYETETFLAGGKPASPPVVVAQAGGRSLRVADGSNATLCAGLRRLSCPTPPVDAVPGYADRDGDVVTGVLSEDVASVTFTLAGGKTARAPTTDGPAYTGRYAGRVRFLAATVPATTRIVAAVPRDAGGRRVGTVYVREPAVAPVRRHFAPGVDVVRSRFIERRTLTCLRPPHPPNDIGGFDVCSAHRSEAGAVVSCAPRRAVVFGTLPRGVRVGLELGGGTTLRPRVRRVKGLGRAWSIVLPRAQTLRRLRYSSGKTQRLRLPPAGRQCGYEAA